VVPSRSRVAALNGLKRLVWIYFWLIIFEGALRKWVVPSLATPLLVVRDPVLLALYYGAAQSRVFRFGKDQFFQILLAIGTFMVAGSIVAGAAFPSYTIPTLLYGIRCNFLHLPLITLIARLFTWKDLREMGKWILITAIPMSILMAIQFGLPNTHWLNSGVEGNFDQIDGGGGRIRPPGTFSFIVGPANFYSLVAAFLIQGFMQAGYYPYWLKVAGVGALGLGLLSSAGSRALILGVAVVFGAWVMGLAANPKLLARYATSIFAMVIVFSGSFFLFQQTEFYGTGLNAIQARWGGDIIGRVVDGAIPQISTNSRIPFFGYGLGTATNGGRVLLNGPPPPVSYESEVSRVRVESGPLLGSLYIVFRYGVALWLGVKSYQKLRSGQFLPLLLFGCTALNLATGQLGQPTILGFTVLSGGLCFAACCAPIPELIGSKPHK
jgi:hypothetical protein